MKLNIAALLVAAASTATAGDTFRVHNMRDPSNNWRAYATWYRHTSDPPRPVNANGCTYAPYTPWSDVTEICWDWTNNRGHFKLAGNSNPYCFYKTTGDSALLPGVSSESYWGRNDGTQCPCQGGGGDPFSNC